jgi:hypothetical protein
MKSLTSSSKSSSSSVANGFVFSYALRSPPQRSQDLAFRVLFVRLSLFGVVCETGSELALCARRRDVRGGGRVGGGGIEGDSRSKDVAVVIEGLRCVGLRF